MKAILRYTDWLSESQQKRPVRSIKELDINRKFTRHPHTGDRYETELFPMFKRLKPRIDALSKKPSLEEFFAMLQNSDNQFYTMVQADTIAQPDVRELWRDLTGRRASKMKKYNLVESQEEAVWKSEIDPEWTVFVLFSNDDLYDKVSGIFDQFGLAFAELESKLIFIDGEHVREQNLTDDHILAVEAHEISHHILNHKSGAYSDRQEREADWLGIRLLDQMGYGKASSILEKRYSDQYGESSNSLDETDSLESALLSYLN
jgi:hypothetical protein